jgi:hypothetical protein
MVSCCYINENYKVKHHRKRIKPTVNSNEKNTNLLMIGVWKMGKLDSKVSHLYLHLPLLRNSIDIVITFSFLKRLFALVLSKVRLPWRRS